MPQIDWASVEKEFERTTSLLLQESMSSFAFPSTSMYQHSFVSSDPERTHLKQQEGQHLAGGVSVGGGGEVAVDQLAAEVQTLQQQVSHLHTTHIPALVEQAVHTTMQRIAKQLHEDIQGRVEDMMHVRLGRMEAKLKHAGGSMDELFQRVADAEKALRGQMHATKQTRQEADDTRALILTLQSDLSQLKSQQSQYVTAGALQDLGLADATKRHSELTRTVAAINSKVERIQADMSAFRGQLDTFVHEAIQVLQQQPAQVPQQSLGGMEDASEFIDSLPNHSFASASMSFMQADPSARLGRLLGDGLKSFTLKCVRQSQISNDAQYKSEVLQDLMALDQTVRTKLQQNETRVQDMLSTMRDSLEHQNQLISRRMNEYCTHAEYRELRNQLEQQRLTGQQLLQEVTTLDGKVAKLQTDMNAHVVDTTYLQNVSGGGDFGELSTRVAELENKNVVLEGLITKVAESKDQTSHVQSLITEATKHITAEVADKENRLKVVEDQCEQLYNEVEALQTQTETLETTQPKLAESLKRQFVKLEEFHRIVTRMDVCEEQLLQLEADAKIATSANNQQLQQHRKPPLSQLQTQQVPSTPKHTAAPVIHENWSREADKVIESMRRRDELNAPSNLATPAAPSASGESSTADASATRSETVQCSFCLRRIPRASLASHQETCELRMENCQNCGSRVLAIKMPQHLKTCHRRPL